MPRRPKKAKSDRSSQGEAKESHDTIEEHDDGIFAVRMITGSSSTKPYRCPGCDQLIKTATPHIVAWQEHDVETRRHWHTPCWRARGRRKPRIERTRNAPKY
ncbi:MAG: hypothetical protein ACO3YA_04385 [Candidatus Nanopelagicaceae bacterium]